MNLGLGLYKSLLNSDNFRFAKQAGVTHIVAQLVDYIKGGKKRGKILTWICLKVYYGQI